MSLISCQEARDQVATESGSRGPSSRGQESNATADRWRDGRSQAWIKNPMQTPGPKPHGGFLTAPFPALLHMRGCNLGQCCFGEPHPGNVGSRHNPFLAWIAKANLHHAESGIDRHYHHPDTADLAAGALQRWANWITDTAPAQVIGLRARAGEQTVSGIGISSRSRVKSANAFGAPPPREKSSATTSWRPRTIRLERRRWMTSFIVVSPIGKTTRKRTEGQ
jgi:hypothetical protein